MHRIGIMTYEITGLEKLNRLGQLIIVNHPTLIDIVFLISTISTANSIVKEKLWHNPFTKGPVVNARCISNGDPEKMIDVCVACLQNDGTMIIIPGGTRWFRARLTSFGHRLAVQGYWDGGSSDPELPIHRPKPRNGSDPGLTISFADACRR